eukprot:15365786-Ditylum_brightwellii.AAC.1
MAAQMDAEGNACLDFADTCTQGIAYVDEDNTLYREDSNKDNKGCQDSNNDDNESQREVRLGKEVKK